ncbi:hypothetical protein Q7P37_010462 [Cladosporium fusiforme]
MTLLEGGRGVKAHGKCPQLAPNLLWLEINKAPPGNNNPRTAKEAHHASPRHNDQKKRTTARQAQRIGSGYRLLISPTLRAHAHLDNTLAGEFWASARANAWDSLTDEQGRKTGITLKDTGVRDEHGLEPVSGIFSSPASPPKQAQGTSSSNAMELQESSYNPITMRDHRNCRAGRTDHTLLPGSAPDVDETLHLRKTPRLPPPRASTPRHTNIGSPKRMSSARPHSRSADPLMASEASPNRTSSHPPANRVLNFGRQNVRRSIEGASPFKPKRVLRRSVGGVRKDIPAEVAASSPGRDGKPELPDAEANIAEEDELMDQTHAAEVEAETGAEMEPQSDQSEEQQQLDNQFSDDAPPMFYNDDEYDAEPDAHDADVTEAFEHAEELLKTTPLAKPAIKARGRPRESGASVGTSLTQRTPGSAQTAASSRKRDRTELEENEEEEADQTHQSIEQTDLDDSQVSLASERSAKRQRGRASEINAHDQTQHTIDQADETQQSIEQGDNEASQISTASQQSAKRRPGRPRKSDITVLHDQTEQTIDPALLAHGDSYLAPVNEEDEVEAAPAPPITKKKPGRKPKAQQAAPAPKAPKERDPNQSMRHTTPGSQEKSNDRAPSRSPSKRAGSVSNVNLRASTPFEDAHQRMSRSGRPILKPLKHWAGESYVWKNGEVEGIIRADEVKAPRGGKKKARGRRRAPRAGGRGIANELGDIAEESDTESTVPDDWEDQVGVIAGTVAAWDPDAQTGNPDAPIREDIAFASSSILTRDVAGSAFQYAKIMTLPFFGSGIVELPPDGFKRAKNSRKMQMVFFVHEGKVLVTVGPPTVDSSGQEPETNEFAISKGGVWVVPRGMFLSPLPFPTNHVPPLATPQKESDRIFMAATPVSCGRPRRANVQKRAVSPSRQHIFRLFERKAVVQDERTPYELARRHTRFFGGELFLFSLLEWERYIADARNNYSITNESSTKSARIFFAQGCEVEAEMASQE